ncbi:uncharacterized protein MELLADRAFT_90718 [Melampsora larici-populina 98AG31]|uniref:C3H1-type domain-containing protein n=1 Tax=Melampsora larici-populina (strain 98AG31 / pathotype 3-4-7) TaxID=747676 RepID=F4RXX4_MELLP|nr:uncharacterized protein MELLADRAFT_90718 [Melampsora larici-populina 98AG31]EGG02807.1 hypothetical protein MELLADRAFT_90718 [Melampsora larici-populina 98AG31]
MTSYQTNNTQGNGRGRGRGQGRGRGFRGRGRGTSNHHSTRESTLNPNKYSYPAVEDQQMEVTKSNHQSTFTTFNDFSSSSVPTNSYHHPYHPSQPPSFTNPLTASINSAIQTVLPTYPTPNLSQPNPIPTFPYTNTSQTYQAVQLTSPNYFSSTGMVSKNSSEPTRTYPSQVFQPTNSHPMYMSNPYTQAYNAQMISNPTYPNPYAPINHMNYPSMYSPQPMYSSSQNVPMNHLSNQNSFYSSNQLPTPRVTSEGYSISKTALGDETGSYSDHLHQKPKHQNRNSNHEKYRCEPCHQDFQSFPSLLIHQNTHTKCSEPGCKYEGNSKSVEIHEEDRHLRFKPGKEPNSKSKRPDGPAGATIQGLGYALQTEEQVMKWIEERRKRWPSSKVIAEKALKASKDSSQTSRSGRGERSVGRGLVKSGRGKTRVGTLALRQPRGVTSRGSEDGSAINLPQKRARPNEDEDDELDDDDEDEEAVLRDRYLKSRSTNSVVNTTKPEVFQGSVGNDQVTNKGSDDENEDMDHIKDAVSSKIEIKVTKIDSLRHDPIHDHQTVNQTDQVIQKNINGKNTRVCKWWKIKRNCKRGDSCLFAHPPRDQVTKKQKTSSKNKVTTNMEVQSGSGSGLLSKAKNQHINQDLKTLLEKDIQQDIADLSSVISFLVENDFLENTEMEIGEERLIESILPDDRSTTLSVHPTSILPKLLSSDALSGSEEFDTEDDDDDDDDDDDEDDDEDDEDDDEGIEDVKDQDNGLGKVKVEDQEDSLGKVKVDSLVADLTSLDERSVIEPIRLTEVVT